MNRWVKSAFEEAPKPVSMETPAKVTKYYDALKTVARLKQRAETWNKHLDEAINQRSR